MEYSKWYNLYNESVSELSIDTWEKGIITELVNLNIKKGKVLDVGAGTGIGADLLKKVGNFYLVACDQSKEMLSLAMNKYDDIYISDINNLNIDEKLDLIVSGFDTINYLDETSLEIFLEKASKFLKKDGYLIFDYSSPKLLQVDWEDLSYEDVLSNKILKWHHKYNKKLKRSETNISLYEDNIRIWSEKHIQYSYSPFDIFQKTKRLNLSIIKVRNIENSLFSPECNTHLFVIRKNA